MDEATKRWWEPDEALVPTDEASDLDLVAAAQVDRAAFAVLYRRYVDAIYGYCYRRLGSREAAEDATSLVFARALDALPRLRTGSVRGWLFTIAHNVVVNDRRRRDALRNQPLDRASGLSDASPGPEELAIGAERQQTLRRLMGQLSPDDRHLLELRLAGLAGAEIAQVLGRSVGAVRVAQFRAITRMRDLLERERSRADAP